MGVDVLSKMKKEMIRRRYSPRTVKTYLFCVRRFVFCNHKDVRKYSKADIKEFLERLAEKGVAGSTINVYLQALRFMMEYSLGKRVWVDVKYSKTERKRLPTVLSKSEVVSLLRAISNPKHLLMVKLMYSAGLRVSELLDLRVRDLEIEKGYGWVRQGKGNKDRMFVLARTVVDEVGAWVCGKDPEQLLFTGHRGRLSARTVQEIIKNASRKAGIRKKVHPHTLRHSFATHLIENGCALSSLQTLLGHSSAETTMVYVHMQPKGMIGTESPLDTL